MKPSLKSLELHGYKTFAGRVLFEFPGNITAIVGPNGSGKSNISDALRWVLGEQSYALLRGKKTEDMIFLGSDQRPKAGMASATILFDNETGWLPVDYSEVAISRRAYRDGSNEYLLNKQRVRLKDIAELLAQSGLAERTYTVIGQGLVDAALSLRPEERRKFFEEAAGIGLFRARREEALNRLESTRRNLERVTDILGELEPRLKGLERQAKRVEEYDRIKADLQLLLKDWYGFHWHNSQNEFLRNREILKNQEEKVNQARVRRGEIEEKVDTVRLHLQDLRGQLNSWHTESSDYHREREKIGREIAVLEERLRSFEGQEMSLKSDLMRNEEMAVTYQDRLLALQNEKDKVNQELNDCHEQLLAVQKTFALRKSERDKLESEINQTRRKLVELETKQVQLIAHQQEVQNRIEAFAASRQSLLDGIEKNKGAIQSAQQKLDEVNRQKSLTDDRLKKLEDEYQVLNERIITCEEDEKKLVLELGKIETDIAKSTAQLEVVRQAEKAFSGLGEGAKNLLSAVSKGKINGQLRAVNSLMDVPYELEVAISAALGEQLDAIMINGGLDPEAILSYLESDESGRAMLIPADALREGEKLKGINHPGVIGVASELVKAESGAGKLLTFLLGQVLVVENRRTAREIQSDLPVWGKAVTLKGEVFAGNGIIIAGKENRSSVLSRPRQKKDLEDQIAISQKQHDERQGKLDSLRDLLGQLKTQKKELEIKRKNEQTVAQQLNQTSTAAERDLAKLSQQLDWQNNQIGTLARQAENADSEIESTQSEIEFTEKAIADQNQMIHSSLVQLRAIPIDEIQEQLVHWNTTQAITERALKDVTARYLEFENTIQQNTLSINQIRKRIEDLISLRTDAEAAMAAAKSLEENLAAKIEESRQKIEPAETERSKLEAEYSSLQHEYTMAQQMEANADRVYTQAQLEFSRSREALENLRRRIEEDFGLVSLEYSEDVTGPTPLPLEGVGQLAVLTELPKGLDESINRQRALLRRMGAINPEAQKEFIEVKERHQFLTSQLADLQKADTDLRQIIAELDDLMHQQFRTTFNAVAAEFKEMFTRLFGGGSARLVMTDADNPTETGIDIEAKLPGRREQGLSLLSGGERSLTAVALVFSLIKVSPTPFCILDEVDAMLDEANVGRFTELLRELSQETQFIVITHNRNTVQVADVIYGVTMGRDSASQVISLRLDEVSDELVK